MKWSGVSGAGTPPLSRWGAGESEVSSCSWSSGDTVDGLTKLDAEGRPRPEGMQRETRSGFPLPSSVVVPRTACGRP